MRERPIFQKMKHGAFGDVRPFSIKTVAKPSMTARVKQFRISEKMPNEKGVLARGIAFSEVPIWIAFFFAFFIAISEAIFGFTLRNALLLKHIPLLLFLPGFAFYFVGRIFARSSPLETSRWFEQLWPFLLLGIFAIVGSLYARYVLDIRESFLVLGLYIFLMPLFFLFAREQSFEAKVIRPVLMMWGAAAIVASVGAVFYFRKVEVLHNIEFLVQPFFLYAYIVQKSVIKKILAALLIAAVTFLTQKLTGYINGILAISYIIIVATYSRVSTEWRSVVRLFAILMLVVVGTLSVVAFFQFRQYLPSGNLQVRLHQYENVFLDFLASPIWGQAYTASSGEVYVEYTRSLNIPTHSDILDLLKQGGLIAFGLWSYGMALSARTFFRRALIDKRNGAFFHAMAFFTISTAANCGVNPLFLTPVHAFIIWGFLAIGLAIASNHGSDPAHE